MLPSRRSPSWTLSRWCLVLCLTLQMPGFAATIPSRASLTGRVLIEGTDPNSGLEGTSVLLASTGGDLTQQTVSGVDGAFLFANIPSGVYKLSATRPGCLAGFFGENRPGHNLGAEIVVNTNPVILEPITLYRGGVISGRIANTDATLPSIPLAVIAIESMGLSAADLMDVTRVAGVNTFRTSTDDRGVYRLANLPPGAYLLFATPQASNETVIGKAPERVVVPTYFPGAALGTDARAVTVGLSEERSDTDFVLVQEPAGVIDGLALIPNRGAQTFVTGRATAERMGADRLAPVRRSATIRPDGRFSLAGLPVGDYAVEARGSIAHTLDATVGATAGAVSFVGTARVRVASASVTLTLPLEQAATVAGRAMLSSQEVVGFDWSGLSIVLRQGRGANGTVQHAGALNSQGFFSVSDLGPGQYVMSSLGRPRGSELDWPIVSASLDGRDVSVGITVKPGERVRGLQVFFEQNGAGVSGVLYDATGSGTYKYVVVALALDSLVAGKPGRVRLARPRSDGRFTIWGLTPGEHFLAAFEDFRGDAPITEATVSEMRKRAVRIRTSPGAVTHQDLSIR